MQVPCNVSLMSVLFLIMWNARYIIDIISMAIINSRAYIGIMIVKCIISRRGGALLSSGILYSSSILFSGGTLFPKFALTWLTLCTYNFQKDFLVLNIFQNFMKSIINVTFKWAWYTTFHIYRQTFLLTRAKIVRSTLLTTN